MRDELGQTGAATRRRVLGGALAALTVLAPLTWPPAARGQQPATATAAASASASVTTEAAPAAVVEAIRAAATAYREAVTKGDAAAIRAAWTADGDIVDGWGTRLEARADGVLTGGAATGPRPEFHVGETRLRVIAPDVVLEDGSVDVVLPGMKTPIEGWFSAIWVRQGGGWKLAALRESERPVATDESMLADLDWMVGDWSLVAEGAEPKAAAADMTIRWDAGRTFLIREARIPELSGGDDPPRMIDVHQRIGWDPTVRRIRSWSFSSDGSRGEATWFRDGDSWVALLTTVLPDGRQRTAVHIYSYDGRDRCIWRTLPEGLDADAGLPSRVTWIRKPSRSAP
jgi:ketosteroid isomerase-like protein